MQEYIFAGFNDEMEKIAIHPGRIGTAMANRVRRSMGAGKPIKAARPETMSKYFKYRSTGAEATSQLKLKR